MRRSARRGWGWAARRTSRWLTYVEVESTAACRRTILERGGELIALPFEGALCARDRHGAGFAAVAVERQAFGTGSSRGFDARYRDAFAHEPLDSAAFYREVFGWKTYGKQKQRCC
ncbi:MAG: hypothetical protein RLO52_39980 [Sandaracinaceae bacterium]